MPSFFIVKLSQTVLTFTRYYTNLKKNAYYNSNQHLHGIITVLKTIRAPSPPPFYIYFKKNKIVSVTGASTIQKKKNTLSLLHY